MKKVYSAWVAVGLLGLVGPLQAQSDSSAAGSLSNISIEELINADVYSTSRTGGEGAPTGPRRR